MSKRFLIHVYTNWCGEDNDFSAIVKDESELDSIAQEAAYNNFSDFNGIEGILEEMFPSEEDYTDEQRDEAAEFEGDYYSYNIEEWDESRNEEEWAWYELIYDCTKNE